MKIKRICPACQRSIPITRDELLYFHYARGGDKSLVTLKVRSYCRMSGKSAK
jgi:hypothetical protein